MIVRGNGFGGEGQARVRGDISSQFLSGLLHGGAACGEPTSRFIVEGELVSKPYVSMTLRRSWRHLACRWNRRRLRLTSTFRDAARYQARRYRH